MRRCLVLALLAGCATTPHPHQATPQPAPQFALPAEADSPGATILVGDCHGTTEIPAFVGDLVTQLAAKHPVVVALEIAASETPSFDAFLASDGSPSARAALLGDFWWQDPIFQDGRRSVAMADMIERFRRLHVPVARFDDIVSPDRDRGLANNVLAVRAAHPGATLVVYAGELHTRRNGHPEFPGMTFMAGHLRAAGMPFFAIEAKYENGTAWVCMDDQPCDQKKLRGDAPGRGLHVGMDNDGNYDAWVGLGPISSSPPASGNYHPAPPLPASFRKPGATILVGDMHGTREIPAFVRDLVYHLSFHPLVVALEIPAAKVPSLDAFLKSDGSPAARAALLRDPWWQDAYQDGRRSEAMADLINGLRRARVTVVPFDAPDAEDRDQALAKNVLAARAAHPEATLIVYAGNLHTRRNGHPGFAGKTFMAGYLKQAGLDFLAIDARYEDGAAWVCMDNKPCGVRKLRGHVGASGGLHMEPSADGNYDGWYGLGPISASPPAAVR